MKSEPEQNNISRRGFLKAGTAVAAAAAAAPLMANAATAAAPPQSSNQFDYDIERFKKVDPQLIKYEVAARFKCPRNDSRRLAIGPDGALYIAASGWVSLLNADGRPLREFEVAGQARAVAVSPDGLVYASLRDHIEVFDANGKRLASWAPPQSKAWISGLAVSGETIWAADSGNRVVWRCDRSGKVIARIGEKNKDRNIPGLVAPSPHLDVKMGADGLLRVTNPGRHSVELYTEKGDLELAWGRPSMAIDGFCGCCNPISIALLPDGRHVTCEKGLPRVKIYSEKGVFESVVAGPESFPASLQAQTGAHKSDGLLAGLDAAADAQGRIWILDQLAGELLLMRRKTGV